MKRSTPASRAPRAGLRCLKGLARLGLALVVVFLLLELGMRALGLGLPARGPNNRLPLRVAVSGLEAPRLGEGLRPGASGDVFYPGYSTVPDRTVHYAINRQGFRDQVYPEPKPPGTYRIAVLGDSVTYGTGVLADQTYPKVLERSLAELRPDLNVDVMNCGVYAHNTSQQVAWFRFNVRRFRPDCVLITSTLVDTSGRNIEVEQDSQGPIPRWIARLGLTSGVWPTEDLARATPAQRRTQFLRRNSRVADFLAYHTYRSLRQRLEVAGYEASWADGAPGLQLLAESLRALAGDADEDDFQLIVAMAPSLGELDAYPFREQHAKLAAIAADLGLSFIDLLPVVEGQNASLLRAHVHDRHPNAAAHRQFGEHLSRVLQDRLWPPDDAER